MHVICAWIGNSKAVAAKHCLQVTDERFQRATQKAAAQSGHGEDGSGGQGRPESPEMSIATKHGQ
jgi:hypothetical protein